MMTGNNKILFGFLIFCACTARGQELKQHEVLESSVTFEIKNAGITVEGNMGGLEAMIFFDQKNLAQTSMKATIDPSTVETGIGIRDNHLKRSDYFDVEKYPEIKIVSRKFKKDSGNSLEGTFDLSIKGVTRQVVIPFTVVRDKDIYRMEGIFVLNRLDYELGEESFIMGEEVKVLIEIISR
jgi:polyisoprenoid-binding protein YceI